MAHIFSINVMIRASVFSNLTCASFAIALVVFTASLITADNNNSKSTPPSKGIPIPTHSNVSYGSHPHQLMDVHLPSKGRGPFPVLLWYGGLWEESKNVPGLNKFLASGVAVIGVQSRTLNDAMKEKIIRLSPGQWTIQVARCSFSV